MSVNRTNSINYFNFNKKIQYKKNLHKKLCIITEIWQKYYIFVKRTLGVEKKKHVGYNESDTQYIVYEIEGVYKWIKRKLKNKKQTKELH